MAGDASAAGVGDGAGCEETGAPATDASWTGVDAPPNAPNCIATQTPTSRNTSTPAITTGILDRDVGAADPAAGATPEAGCPMAGSGASDAPRAATRPGPVRALESDGGTAAAAGRFVGTVGASAAPRCDDPDADGCAALARVERRTTTVSACASAAIAPGASAPEAGGATASSAVTTSAAL
jgi:hypothetical protein